MKRNWTLIIALFALSSLSAQSTLPTAKVEQAFGQEVVADWLQNQPEEIQLSAFYAEHGWVFNEDGKVPQDALQIEELEPQTEGVTKMTAEAFDAATFNPLLFNIKLSDTRPTYIQVGDRGVLMFYSTERLQTLFTRLQINEQARNN